MSRPDPTWYGNIIRSYVAWLVAGALALAAAWPLWHYSQNHWAPLVLAPVAGATVAAIPAASRATCEWICVGIYAGVLVWVMVGLT
ncbi:hypothetical protein ACFX43_05350 [Nocardioides sp. YIM B13467]|uniref:hypothetical protein n=1 Tax=Nocardioides sp. YIM B13467 TaxID=3366294 RepID=UPI00366F2293